MRRVTTNLYYSIYKFEKDEGLRPGNKFGIISTREEKKLNFKLTASDMEAEFKTIFEARHYMYLWS